MASPLSRLVGLAIAWLEKRLMPIAAASSKAHKDGLSKNLVISTF
jgi:hypothetical protein